MPISVAERQYILNQLERLARTDLDALWNLAETLPSGEFFAFMRDALPELADTYHQTSGQLAATWFEQSNPASDYVAKVAEPIARERLQKSTEWALGGDGLVAKDRMAGTLQRALYEGSRETIVVNVESTGSRWLRVARADACPFCRMLATRTGDYAYTSRKSALVRSSGRRYHDLCHCQAVEVRENQTVDEVLTDEQRRLLQQWDDEYQKAVANAGSTNTTAVMSAWREQIAATPATETLSRKMLDDATTVEQAANYIKAKHGINVDGLINSPMAQGIPIETSLARGVDVISAAKAAKPHFVDARTAREFSQAIDDVMTELPFIELDEFKADFYPSGNPLSSMAHAGQRVGPERGNGAQRLVINQFADAEGDVPGTAYDRYRKAISAESYDSRYKGAAASRPAYAVGVHEMGHVIHFNGGDADAVSTKAFIALREHIMQTPEAQALREKIISEKAGAFQRLAGGRLELMPEYEDFERQWFRDNLVSAYSFKDGTRSTGIPDRYESLAEAYTDVRLRGDKAETASKIIYDVMVGAARRNKAKK